MIMNKFLIVLQIIINFIITGVNPSSQELRVLDGYFGAVFREKASPEILLKKLRLNASNNKEKFLIDKALNAFSKINKDEFEIVLLGITLPDAT